MEDFDFNLSIWYSRLKSVIIFFILSFPCARAQTTLSFCDGDDLFVVNEGECKGGINFGQRKPDCICLTGVYRSWNEECEIFDGFIHEFCASTLAEKDLYYKIKGVKLLNGIPNINQDTVAIFGEENNDDQNWNAYTVGMEGWTKSDSIYTVNGFPVVLQKNNDRFICVEPQAEQRRKVCRIFSYENKGVWMSDDGMILVKVMESCNPYSTPELNGYIQVELKAHKCYNIMNKTYSECSLPCEQGRKVRISGSSLISTIREKKETAVGAVTDTLNVTTETMTDDELDEIIPGVSVEAAAPLPSNANFVFHRKLNQYIRLRQVGVLKRPDLTEAAPNRTFSLLEIAKHVVKGACPSSFVSGVFLENALELFLQLHKGQNYRYLEDIELRDYKWIEEILLKCRVGIMDNPLNVQGDKQLPGCEQEGLVENVCYIADGDLSVCEKTTGGKPHQTGKFHYVIDAVWNIIDMTHVLCYPYFQASYRMFHVWEQASEKLFTRDIKNLWYKPEVDLRVYDSILSSQATMNMINLERCTEGAYQMSDLPRLQRPPKQRLNFRRRKRAASPFQSVTKDVDLFCAKNEDDFATNC